MLLTGSFFSSISIPSGTSRYTIGNNHGSNACVCSKELSARIGEAADFGAVVVVDFALEFCLYVVTVG